MKAFRNLSIQRKMTWIMMLTSSGALVLACLAFISYDRISFRSSMVSELEILAEIIGANSTAAVLFDSNQDAVETLSSLEANPHIIAAVIYSGSGDVFAQYHRTNLVFFPPRADLDGYRFGSDYLDMFRRITLDDEHVSTIYIRSDLQDMSVRQVRYFGLAFLFLVGSSLIAYLIISRVQRFISGPILRLSEIANSVSSKRDFSVRAEKDSQDEVGDLIEWEGLEKAEFGAD